MKAWLFCAALLASPSDVYVVEEAPLEWSALSPATFDPTWLLPDRPSGDQRALLDEMVALADLRFDLEDEDGTVLATLGDFLRASRAKDWQARSAWWNRLQAQRPELFAEWGDRLFWLCFDDALFAADWSPEREHARDGILESADWELTEADGEPWSRGDKVLHQAAVWIDADLQAIKEVETDFHRYPEHAGADYEAIYPLSEGAWRGRHPEHGEFSGVTLYFRCDLPWPFGDYECDLRTLNRRDALGRLVTDIYSPSSDFNWLAGRDVFLPLATSSGSPAGHLLVRVYGFDLAGVPDKAHHRQRALRASLGNLRRNAEAHPVRDAAVEEGIPAYTVRGRK